VSVAAPLVADLPEPDPVRFRVSVPGSKVSHRGLSAAVEVLDLVGGIRWIAAAHAHTEERFGVHHPAELDKLLQAWTGRLESPPRPERLAQVRVANSIAPLELPEVGVVERAAAKPDDSGLQAADGRDDIAPPAPLGVLGHERCVIKPERS